MKKIAVTTSWDDGHVLDLTLATLLATYNLAATFYIAPENHELSPKDRLTEDQVRALSHRFEIGAHTMTHPRLSTVDPVTAQHEIAGSKSMLEQWTGKKITSFCYPEGVYDPSQKQLVEQAGFSLARTTKRFAFAKGNDPFELPTTIQAYRHWSDIAPILRETGIAHGIRYYLHWDDLAIALFEKVRMQGGVFHLWGHSWEIEKNNDWERLERVFRYIANRADVDYMTNKALIV